MIKHLLLISAICLGYSCGGKRIVSSDYTVQETLKKEGLKKFIEVEKDSLKAYGTSVAAYGKYFSGMTYFKNTGDTALRVFFTTHTGMKMFDIELSEHACSTVYAVEQLNKPVIMNLLCHDYTLISGIEKEMNASLAYENAKGQQILVRKGDKDTYYFMDSAKELYKLLEVVPGKNKIQTEVHREKLDSTIFVNHRNFNFKLTFKKITLNEY